MASEHITMTQQSSLRRPPRRNTAYSVHFVIRGSKKRRELAYARARNLQRDLGVLPVLKCVK